MPESQKCQTLPPWLWVWFAIYIYNLPALIEKLKEDLGSFLFSTDPAYASITLISRFKLLNSPFWIPYIFLFLGALTILFPHLRTYYIENKFKLTENYPKIPAIIEIEEFLKLHAPNLKIKTNLLSQSEEVFIYPIGYRKTGIAIFGKFIKSWRSDRESSQEILLHEIGHYRNGDTLILGAGSFFEFVVKHSIGIIAFFFLIQIPLVFIDLTNQNRLSLKFFFIYGITDPIVIFFSTLAFFTLPIAGIWYAELNADRYMLTSKINSPEIQSKAIEKLKKEKSLKHWILSQITHPPNSLRRWMAVHSNEEKSVLLFLLFYPLFRSLQLFISIMYALSNYLTLFILRAGSIQDFSSFVKPIIIDCIHEGSYRWLLFSIGIILWPILAVYWVRFFSGMYEKCNLENYKSYFLSAVVLLCFFFFSNRII